jgi:hypothetical protein
MLPNRDRVPSIVTRPRGAGMVMRIAGFLALVGILMTTPAIAQTTPCGRVVLSSTEASGSPTEDRFIPAPPEHVEASVLRALPAVGARLKEKKGLVLTGTTDGGVSGLLGAWSAVNSQAGVKGAAAGTTNGEWIVELRPETRDGAKGTHVKIRFRKGFGMLHGKNGATPLMGEIECLSGLLSSVDPLVNPRGSGATDAAATESAVTLAESTPLKVVLRDPWFSRDVAKTAGQAQIVFEVAANVDVEGATLIRKGALAVGRFTQVTAASGFGKGGSMAFVIDHVTAVDGQSVVVRGAREGLQGLGMNVFTAVQPIAGTAGGIVAAALTKGYNVLLRAGTTFDVEVSGTHSIKVRDGYRKH